MSRPVAIVTGGRRGIGRAIARSLAEAGFDLVVVDLPAPAEAVEKLHSDLARYDARSAFVAGDIADLADHERLVEDVGAAFGRIDCLVNNAGIASPERGDPLDLRAENFDRVLAVNLCGTVFLTHAVARAMLRGETAGPRTIINITSASAELASPERVDYCISKAGLSMWTKALALRLTGQGIAVFEVRPGIIRTEMTSGVAAKYDALIAEGLVPALRWGEAEDVAAVVAALATGKFGFAAGSVINADGGLSIPRL